VAAFLDGRVGWGAIASVVADTIDACEQTPVVDAGDVIEADRRARLRAEQAVRRRGLAA
jgi:1-deoxy-D-xylulose 5-phosphate reductoisomerase